MVVGQSGLIGKICMCYSSNLIVYSKRSADHEQDVPAVLTRLTDAGLKLKETTCSFNSPSVQLLGYIISADGVAAMEAKVKCITNLASPSSVT